MVKTAFLHGKSINKDGSFHSLWTKEVELITREMAHHKLGLSYTRTGYGAAIPTAYMVRFNGRLRRVYVRSYSNAGTVYIKAPAGEMITVQLEG